MGPINVGVYASDLNFGYAGSSSIISCSSSNSPYSIDHAILILGYNTTLWFVKNSWGKAGAIMGSATFPKLLEMTAISGNM